MDSHTDMALARCTSLCQANAVQSHKADLGVSPGGAGVAQQVQT